MLKSRLESKRIARIILWIVNALAFSNYAFACVVFNGAEFQSKNIEVTLHESFYVPPLYFGDPYSAIRKIENIKQDGTWKQIVRDFNGPYSTDSNEIMSVVTEITFQNGMIHYPERFGQAIAPDKISNKNKVDFTKSFCKVGFSLPTTTNNIGLQLFSGRMIEPGQFPALFTNGFQFRNDFCTNEMKEFLVANTEGGLEFNSKDYEKSFGSAPKALYLNCTFFGKTTPPTIEEVKSVLGSYFDVKEHSEPGEPIVDAISGAAEAAANAPLFNKTVDDIQSDDSYTFD